MSVTLVLSPIHLFRLLCINEIPIIGSSPLPYFQFCYYLFCGSLGLNCIYHVTGQKRKIANAGVYFRFLKWKLAFRRLLIPKVAFSILSSLYSFVFPELNFVVIYRYLLVLQTHCFCLIHNDFQSYFSWCLLEFCYHIF